ncbi:c-type cytochrome [Aggregatilinea lenta]|uniref:c-type cytochrome n=1 Tax=Aggregatilinea lenta TaxID=913108 RepID=UPI0013C2BE75|nr:cytochrome c [Aggregatilinea lenta]
MKRHWTIILLTMLAVLSLALAACGGDDDDGDNDNEVAPIVTEVQGELEDLATEAATAVDETGDMLEGAATEASDALEAAATEASGEIEAMATEAAGAMDEAQGELEEAGTEVAQAVSEDDIANADAAHGDELFQASCASCHAIDSDEVIVGPSLQNIANEAGEMEEGMDAVAYLHESLVDPGAFVVEGYENIMPSFDDWPESDINDTIAFLMTLDGGS